MRILGIDTATQVCGVALINDNVLVAEYIQNIKKTHSQRLLPLIDAILKDTGVDKSSIDALAVAAGPGSFTGLRIGVATARGLAQGLNIPAVGISTLAALAENVITGENELICPLLDARREQVYTAIYRWRHQNDRLSPEVLLEPSALSINDLLEKLSAFNGQVYFPGDAHPKYAPMLRHELGARYGELPAPLTLNRASSVAMCALRKLKHAAPGDHSPYKLQPFYLRLPEAERRLQEGIAVKPI